MKQVATTNNMLDVMKIFIGLLLLKPAWNVAWTNWYL